MFRPHETMGYRFLFLLQFVIFLLSGGGVPRIVFVFLSYEPLYSLSLDLVVLTCHSLTFQISGSVSQQKCPEQFFLLLHILLSFACAIIFLVGANAHDFVVCFLTFQMHGSEAAISQQKCPENSSWAGHLAVPTFHEHSSSRLFF